MTEDEAKETTCPMTFVRQFGPYPCRASQCMAWRWHDDRVLRRFDTGEISGPIKAGESYDGSKYFADEVPSTTRGFCGLAGKP